MALPTEAELKKLNKQPLLEAALDLLVKATASEASSDTSAEKSKKLEGPLKLDPRRRGTRGTGIRVLAEDNKGRTGLVDVSELDLASANAWLDVASRQELLTVLRKR